MDLCQHASLRCAVRQRLFDLRMRVTVYNPPTGSSHGRPAVVPAKWRTRRSTRTIKRFVSSFSRGVRRRTDQEKNRNANNYKVKCGRKAQKQISSHNTQKISSLSYDIEGRAELCVERCCELAKKYVFQLKQEWTPFI